MAGNDLDVEEYGAVPESASSSISSTGKSAKSFVVAAAVIFTMACALTMMAGDTDVQSDRVEELAVTPDNKLERLVQNLVKRGDTMSLASMEKQLDDWRHDPSTLLDIPEGHRFQVLARVAAGVKEVSLEASPTLCAKKEVILGKFDQLLKKLGGEELALNISNDAVQAEQKAALVAWLDSESDYRLTVQKSEDAKQGAQYAEQQYEKYHTAFNDATKAASELLTQNNAERQSLVEEQALIQEIMRLVGIIDGTASKAVSGSTKLVQTPQNQDPAKVNQEVKKLEAMVAKVQQPKLAQYLKKLKTSLESTDETSEVAAILKQMLQDIADRIRILDNLDAAASEQSTKMQDKLIEWQTKLVDLSNAADKAKAAAQAQALQRQTLAGRKKETDARAKEEAAAYKLTLPPYIKEIYVITVIKQKIIDSCK